MNTNGMIRDIEYLGSNGAGTWINLLTTPLVGLQKTASDSIELSVTGYLKRAFGWNNLFGLYANNPGGWIIRMAEYPELRYWYAASQSYDYLNKLCNYTVYYGKSGEGSKLLVDGKIVFESTSTPTFNGLHTTYTGSGIFSTNGSSCLAKGSYFCGLVCKKNGVKVIDLVPVRVGQVGYAYDKVTKTLYPSSGTGSFVLGPDVAKPVMGLYGMRKAALISDYIQNGLVAHFDGIENVGKGMRNPNATQWNDLTGNETPLKCYYSTPAMQWGDNYCYGGMGYLYNTAKYRDYSKDGYTQEIVTRLGYCEEGSGRGPLNSALLAGFHWYTNGNYYIVNSLGTRGAYLRAVGLWDTRLCHNISFSMTPDGLGKGIVDGGYFIFNATNASTPYPLIATRELQLGPTDGSWVNSGVHSLRIYNRALSPAEIAHNYAIDKARFNLP